MESSGNRNNWNTGHFRWNNNVVPYFFTYGVTSGDKALIQKQMRKIQRKTCVRFKQMNERSAPAHRLKIQVGWNSCGNEFYGQFSGVVKTWGHTKEVLFMSHNQLTDHPSCRGGEMYSGGVLHELMHALGAIHTHQRQDRDRYVTIDESCLSKYNDKYQFTKTNFHFPSDSLPYEYKSLMHYGCDTLSKCNQGQCTCPTIQPKQGGCSQTGSNVASLQDWKMINHYHC